VELLSTERHYLYIYIIISPTKNHSGNSISNSFSIIILYNTSVRFIVSHYNRPNFCKHAGTKGQNLYYFIIGGLRTRDIVFYVCGRACCVYAPSLKIVTRENNENLAVVVLFRGEDSRAFNNTRAHTHDRTRVRTYESPPIHYRRVLAFG